MKDGRDDQLVDHDEERGHAVQEEERGPSRWRTKRTTLLGDAQALLAARRAEAAAPDHQEDLDLAYEPWAPDLLVA